MRKVGVWGTPRYAQIWKSTILSKNWLMYIQLLSVLSINLTLHRWVRTLLWWVRTLRWWVRTLRTALEHTWIDDQLILLFTLLETCSPAYHNTQLWFLCRHPGDFWITLGIPPCFSKLWVPRALRKRRNHLLSVQKSVGYTVKDRNITIKFPQK